jgi:hypothetical protein
MGIIMTARTMMYKLYGLQLSWRQLALRLSQIRNGNHYDRKNNDVQALWVAAFMETISFTSVPDQTISMTPSNSQSTDASTVMSSITIHTGRRIEDV